MNYSDNAGSPPGQWLGKLALSPPVVGAVGARRSSSERAELGAMKIALDNSVAPAADSMNVNERRRRLYDSQDTVARRPS